MFAINPSEEVNRLSTLFAHYVRINQWECAKVTVRQLHARVAGKAKELLRDVVLKPSSSPVLVHLASQEMTLLFGEDSLPANNQSAMEMTLQSCKALGSREQARVLDRLKQLMMSGGSDPLKKLSSAEVAKLQEVVALFPLLGNSLIGKLPGQLVLYLDIIQSLLAKAHFEEALSFVPFLQVEHVTSKESRLLDALLEKLFSFGSPFLVYQALLGSSSEQSALLDRFATLEEAVTKADYREPLPRVFRDITDHAQFWRALHSLSLVAGKHFFEIVCEKAVLAAHEGRHSDCTLLLRHFDKLAPLVMALFASKIPGEFESQRGLLSALHLSSWRLEAAAWCSSQTCLILVANAALQILEKDPAVGLLDLIGSKLGEVQDRDGLLKLLHHCVEDKESCLLFFALKDIHDCKPSAHVWLVQMRDWKTAACACLKACSVLAPSIDTYAQLVESVRCAYRHHNEPENDDALIDADFRLKVARRLKSVSVFSDSGVQILQDAAMAGEWDLCGETRKRFGLTETNCAAVISFVEREEELCRRARVANEEDFLALADLSFSLSDAKESIRALELAVAAAATANEADMSELLSRALVVARGRNLSLKEVLTMSREFPATLPLLKAWVDRETRIRAAAQNLATDCDEASASRLKSELGEALDATAPLSVFLRYVLVLKRAGMTLESSPEEILSVLVQRNDVDLARSVAAMLGVKLVDALVARKGVAISLRELELIAVSDSLLAARVALQRQGDSANLELLDFAESVLVHCTGDHGDLIKAVASCRLFAAVDNGSFPWSFWSDPVKFHRHLCVRLFDVGRFDDALAVADEYLPEGPSDAVLACVARQGGPDCWRFIVRCSDRQLGAELALSLLEELDLAEAIDVLEMCVRCGRPQLETVVVAKLKLLRAYLPILHHRNVFGPWRTWQELNRACEEDTALVVRQLLEWKQFDLAKMISECLGSGANLDIDADALLHLLEHGGDEESVSLFLQTLKEPHAAVRSVLQACQVPESRLVLWGFLKDSERMTGARALSLLPASASDEASAGPPRSASRARRGLFNSTDGQIVGEGMSSSASNSNNNSANSIVPLKKSLRVSLARLEAFPASLVESLIMNEKISELGQIFKCLPSLVNDERLIAYARKALAFDWAVRESVRDFSSLASISASPTPAPPVSLAADEFVVLTGNEIEDMATRRGHFYRKAPSVNLSTAILDLCSSPRYAGRACLDICSHLSSLLSSTPSSGLLLLLNLIKQLLFYAKLQFSKENKVPNQHGLKFLIDDGGGGEAGIAVCQTFLAHVDLLHDLYMEDCGLHCSLEDLSDPRKARVVRDKLVSQDRMKLATAVATKCAVETEPVWMAWGLRLLRLGDYDAAKEKINKCVESPDRINKGSLFDRSQMLTQILDILSEEPQEREALRDDLHLLEDALKHSADADTISVLPASLSTASENKQALSPVRYMQCVYYVSRIGTPAQLIRFWLSQGLLEDACRYIISGNLAENVFISEVLTHCLAFNTMKELFACLPRVDPKGNRKTRYLVQACKYLNEAHAFDLLLEMQEFMGDWCLAGLSCVKLFHIESNDSLRVQYLKMAEKHFSTALKESQQNRVRKSVQGARVEAENVGEVPGVATPTGTDDFNQQNMPLSENEMSKYFRKVMLQLSIMEFLEQRPTVSENEELRRLSMFGSAKDRIAERLVVLAPASELGFRIMQEFRLPQGEIYSRAVTELVKRKNELAALLKTLKGTIDHEEWDTVLLAIIRAYVDIKDNSSAEKYISKLFANKSQIVAYRLVNLLKTAFVLAAKCGDVDEVLLIRTAALNTNAKTVVQLCNSYLAKSASSK